MSLSDSLPLDQNIVSGRLENGFSYYILNNGHSSDKIELRLFVRAGYPNEKPSELGIAHLVEHLGFRSTAHFPNGLRKKFQQYGLTPGKDIGASTGENTTYKMSIPSQDSAIFNSCIQAFYDFAGGRKLIQTDIDEEKSAVVNELSIANTRGFAIIHETNSRLLGKKLNYQRRVESEINNILKAESKDIQQFYTRWYLPQNQMLVVVGDVDPIAVEQQIRRIFNTLAQSLHSVDNSSSIAKDVVDLRGSEFRYFVIDDPSVNNLRVAIYRMRMASQNVDYPSTFGELKEKVIDDLFESLIKNRFESLVIEKGFSFGDVSNSIERDAVVESSGVDAMETRFQVIQPDSIEHSLRLVNKELRRIARWGFSKGEVERAKRQVKYQRSLKSRASVALIASIVNHAVNKTGLPADINSEYGKLLDLVTSGDITDAFNTWLSSENSLCVVIQAPADLIRFLPSKEQVSRCLGEIADLRPMDHVEPDVTTLLGLPANSSPKKISIRSSADSTKIEMLLANGARVVLKSIEGSGHAAGDAGKGIAIHAFKAGGASLYIGEDYPSALAAAKIQANAGLGNLSFEQYLGWKRLNNENGSEIGASPYITHDESGIKGGCSVDKFEDLLNVIYLQFTQPRKDSIAFNAWMKDNEARNTLVKNPFLLFEDSITHTIGVSRDEFTKCQLERIRLDKAFDIYRELFSDPNEYTFIIVGSFRLEDMIDITNRYLGAIPSGRPATKQRLSIQQNCLTKDNKTFDKLRATLIGDSTGNVHVRILVDWESNADPISEIKLQVLNEVIKYTLFNRLRERERGVYAVSSSIRNLIESNRVVFDIDFEASQDNVESLVLSAIDEIERVASGEVDEDRFRNAVSVVIARTSKQINSPFYWASRLYKQYSGIDRSDIISDLTMLRNFTSSDLADFAKSHLKVDDYALFTLL